jgi:NADH-quinone oxidoreductase subunit J
MVAQNIAFGIVAAVVVLSALKVVTTRNVVHAALYLVLVLAGVGASYVLLAAEFVAVVQVLVYIGAIVVLFLFGIMLTRAPIGRMGKLSHDNWYAGLFVAVLLGAVLAYVLVDAFEDVEVEPAQVGTTALVSDSIFSTYLIPFEVVSVLLLAALVGAIVLARRD